MTNTDKPAKRKKPFAANNEARKELESAGWTVAVVEKTIPRCFRKLDMFGFADLLAISPTRGFLAIQATGGGNGPARVAKLREEPRHAIWLATGGRIQVWDYRKRAGQTKRDCVIIEITRP